MPYQTTITQKGQITIPKAIRDTLSLDRYKKLSIEVRGGKKEITIRPAPDFLKIVKKIKVKKKLDPVKAREYMETNYERL